MAKNILVVDDSDSLRHVVKISLSSEGYNVLEACDGVDALDKMTGEKIHLIISDVNMPKMDGITFVKEVKKDSTYKFTPVIMLTTESQESKMAEGQAAGAKAWLCKPFEPTTLLTAVKRLVLP